VDDCFDVAVAFDVLEHIEDDAKAVSELRRVLKPAGVFIYSVPAGSAIFGRHDHALRHFRRYEQADVRSLLAGWEIEMHSYWNSALYPLAAMKRRSEKSKEHRIESQDYSPLVTSVLFNLLRAEAHFVRLGLPLPRGLSLVGVARNHK